MKQLKEAVNELLRQCAAFDADEYTNWEGFTVAEDYLTEALQAVNDAAVKIELESRDRFLRTRWRRYED